MSNSRERRMAAYVLAVDGHDRVLLVQAGPDGGDQWFLPGGGVEFGEHPEDAVRREVAEETGQAVEHLVLGEVLSDTARARDGRDLHSIRIVYRTDLDSARPLCAEVEGSSVAARWVPLREALDLDLAPFARVCLRRLTAPTSAR